MNAETENKQVIGEWLLMARHDLESAEILLKQTTNHEIVIFHAHQAAGKIIKANYLKGNQRFRFTHDLSELLAQLTGPNISEKLAAEVAYLNNLYPALRYPTGDEITREQAEESLRIAKAIFRELAI